MGKPSSENFIIQKFIEIRNEVLDFIYPYTYCPSCFIESEGLCHACRKDIITYGDFETEGESENGKRIVYKGTALFHYCGTPENLLYNTKMKKKRTAMKELENLFSKHSGQYSELFTGENVLLTSVPSSAKMVSERGFDFGEKLTLILAEKYSLEYMPLFRNNSSKETKKLSREERKSNTEKSIVFRKNAEDKLKTILRKGKARIIVVDDMTTTGFSFRKCGELLRSKGISVSDIHFFAAMKK